VLAQRIAAGILAAAACAAPGEACAETTRVYLGFTFGETRLKDWDKSAIIDDGSFSAINVENSDNGFRVFGGYDFTDSFALEGGFSDLGGASASGTSNGCCFWPGGPVVASSHQTGMDLGFVGRLPLSQSFAVLGRAGVLFWKTHLQWDVIGGPFTFSDTGDDLFFGVGGQYEFSETLALRGEFTRYSIGDNDVDSISLTLISRLVKSAPSP